MKIWLDIATPAQVLFMHPIINELKQRGHTSVITTRHCTETVPLADSFGFPHTVIGNHGGATRVGKINAIVSRALGLVWGLRGQDLSLAVSHSSYSQALAAGIMRLPFVALNDYEGHPGMRIVSRVATKILVPSAFAKENLYRYGASEDQIQQYNGLKEEVYLARFVPDAMFLKNAGFPSDRVLVTMRPPSDVSAYHEFKNPLFDEALTYVAGHREAFVVVLPRTAEQRQRYGTLGLPNVMVPANVLSGPDLIYHSDLVVGAGGTMNREAVVLGTPVYTLFGGLLGSVDQHLIESGKMVRIKDSADIPTIKIRKKPEAAFASFSERQSCVSEIVEKTLSVLANG